MTSDDLIIKKEGWTERLSYDESENKFTLQIFDDVEPVINNNKQLYNLNDGYSPSREWRRVASIPLVVVEMWKKMYGTNPLRPGNEALLRRLLNDPDLRGLRTAPGRL